MVCSNSGRCVVLLYMPECTFCVQVKQAFKRQLYKHLSTNMAHAAMRLASALTHSCCIMAILFFPVSLLNRHCLAPRAVVERLMDVQITVVAEQLLAVWTPHHHSQFLQQTIDGDHLPAAHAVCPIHHSSPNQGAAYGALLMQVCFSRGSMCLTRLKSSPVFVKSERQP